MARTAEVKRDARIGEGNFDKNVTLKYLHTYALTNKLQLRRDAIHK